jgi:hypothetical protein
MKKASVLPRGHPVANPKAVARKTGRMAVATGHARPARPTTTRKLYKNVFIIAVAWGALAIVFYYPGIFLVGLLAVALYLGLPF